MAEPAMYRVVYTVPMSRELLVDGPGEWWYARLLNRMRPWRRRSLHPVTVALIAAGLVFPRWGRRG